MRKLMKTYQIPLVIEPHPDEYNGYEFITLLRYNEENSLNIVDNTNNKHVIAYVLDLCGPAQIDEQLIINIAQEWWDSGARHRYPISIQFSKLGMAQELSRIARTYPIDYISRVIGSLPQYKMGGVYKVKKRKRKQIPKGVEFIDKRLKKFL